MDNDLCIEHCFGHNNAPESVRTHQECTDHGEKEKGSIQSSGRHKAFCERYWWCQDGEDPALSNVKMLLLASAKADRHLLNILERKTPLTTNAKMNEQQRTKH